MIQIDCYFEFGLPDGLLFTKDCNVVVMWLGLRLSFWLVLRLSLVTVKRFVQFALTLLVIAFCCLLVLCEPVMHSKV